VRKFFNIARKDSLVVARDKAAVLVLIAMPLALIFILGSALGNLQSGDFRIKVAIVNDDTGEVGERFVKGLTDAEDLDGLFEMTLAEDADEARGQVESGDLAAALVIPADTSQQILAREPTALQVYQDPGSPIAAGVWAGVVRAAVSYASAELVIARTVEDELTGAAQSAAAQAPSGVTQPPPHGASGPSPAQGTNDAAAMGEIGELDAVTVRSVEADTVKRVSMMSYYSAGMTAMFLLFGSMFGAFAFVNERRQQTLARMMIAPVGRVAIVGGKGLGILFIGLGQLVVLVAGTILLFRVDWGTHVEATLLLGTAEVFAATGLAMTLAALGKTERAIGALGPAVIMLFAATGGAMFPAEAMPAWLRPLQVISPVYWTLDGFLEVIRGATFADVSMNAAIVVLIGIVLYAFGIWRLSYE
jgi:ABC-2 type transport system permease protein